MSYVWGGPEPVAHLHLGTDGSHGSIGITQSLVDALPNVLCHSYSSTQSGSHRSSDRENRSEYFWIDQICIRQNCSTPVELKEKSMQVQLMGEIYRQACCTLVWLVADEDTRLRSSCILRRLSRERLRYQRDYRDVLADVYNLVDTERESYLAHLGAQPFLTRGWIAQEIILSKNLSLLLGAICLNELDLQPTSRWSLGVRLASLINARTRFEEAVSERTKLRALLRLLGDCSGSLVVTEPKDSLLAYGGIWKPHSFQVNYQSDAARLFTDWATCAALDTQGLDFICLAGENASEQVSLPSWVPNWQSLDGESIMLRSKWWAVWKDQQHWDSASGRIYSTQVPTHSTGTLRTRGKLISTVEASYNVPYLGEDEETNSTPRWKPIEQVFVSLFGRLRCLELSDSFEASSISPDQAQAEGNPILEQANPFSAGSSPLALLHLIYMASVPNSCCEASPHDLQKLLRAWRTELDFTSIVVTLLYESKLTDSYPYGSPIHVSDSVYMFSSSVLFLCSNGTLGFASRGLSDAWAKDPSQLKIAIVHGCSMPLILREIEHNGDKVYRVVCCAYLDGAMYGELVDWAEEDADIINLV